MIVYNTQKFSVVDYLNNIYLQFGLCNFGAYGIAQMNLQWLIMPDIQAHIHRCSHKTVCTLYCGDTWLYNFRMELETDCKSKSIYKSDAVKSQCICAI